jgi:hypothetical protein
MSRPVRIALGVLVGALAIVGFGVGYTLLVGGRPDIGNPDFATVKQTLPGNWTLQETTQADFIAGLADEFSEAELRDEMTALQIGDPVRIAITFANGKVSATSQAEAGSDLIGEGTYRLTDNHTMILARDDCEVPVQFRLHEEVLTFGIIGTCPTTEVDLFLGVVLRGAPVVRAGTD